MAYMIRYWYLTSKQSNCMLSSFFLPVLFSVSLFKWEINLTCLPLVKGYIFRTYAITSRWCKTACRDIVFEQKRCLYSWNDTCGCRIVELNGEISRFHTGKYRLSLTEELALLPVEINKIFQLKSFPGKIGFSGTNHYRSCSYCWSFLANHF